MSINIIWISLNKNNTTISEYLKELENSKYYKINIYNSLEESINQIKNIRFEETIIVVDGSIFIKFIEMFQQNISNIYIVPKIIIFTEDKDDFINKNKEYEKIINHPFYNSGGIKTNINELNQFILNPICKNKLIINREDDKLLSFEYVDCKEKLVLPLFYKTLMEISPKDNIEQFTESLYNKYYDKSNNLHIMLDSLKFSSDIPYEILSKYYARIYTDDASRFYSDINKDLRENKKENYISYIKILYEGVKLKSLPLSKEKILYRGTLLLNKEIEKIKKYLDNKIENLPGAIIFSKSFLSFSKSENIAKYFLNINKNNSREFSKVLFKLEKDENIDHSLATHADIEELSFYNEKEVLFFPFSSFEIKNINEIIDNDEKIYEIKLLYLGKYIKEITKDLNKKEKIIPDSEFKKEIIQLGLIRPEIIKKNDNSNKIFKKYEEYKEEIINNKNENNNIEDIITKIKNDEKIKYKNEINLIYYSEKEEAKNIFGRGFVDNNKDNIELKINGIKNCLIDKYKLKKGDNIITLLLKKDLTNLSYMFKNCYSLKNIEELKFLNTSNVKDFSHMFSNHKMEKSSLFNSKEQYILLSDINPLKNWNVSKGISFDSMFRECSILSDIKALEKWDVSNCENFSNMFCSCDALTNINPLKYWNVSKGKKFSFMFFSCSLLSNLKPLENWDVSNGEEFLDMFLGCNSLSDIQPLEKWNVSNGSNFYGLFYGCKLISDISPLKNWDVSNGNNFSKMFYNCESLSDISPLKNWDVSNGNNFSEMFSGCKLLSDINPLNNWNVSNGNNFSKMFYGCKSIKNINVLNWKISDIIKVDDENDNDF